MKATVTLALVLATLVAIPTVMSASSRDCFDRYRLRAEARRDARQAMRDARRTIHEARREVLRAAANERLAYRAALRDSVREARRAARDAVREARRAARDASRWWW
jgi:hypothetical protein